MAGNTSMQATLGTGDADPTQATVTLDIVDEQGKHVDLAAGMPASLSAGTLEAIAGLTSESTAADIVAALQHP
ncbi:MAG: hypothetical protein LKI60_04280 [Bifidobacterium tibiigranuli]|nr:hypothetical protein [Bifidobacterium tibiigranuli]MCI1797446.1 hypothetical protein [Bifidobacterium tibiigranuli]